MTKGLFSTSKAKDAANSSIPSCISQPSTRLTGTDILVLSPTPTVPVDQGNRKRIYAVCRELQQRGARIHFVHYPHEWWFHYVPMDLARQMAEQWDSFHLLPTTRPLHTAAADQHHTIDEWWDHAIGDYLQWLFKRSHFDAFIVNYAYLSKAFDYAPKSTLKILDTHDKFTGRRELFESNGVPCEFFYTTQDQEAIALNRADLVWAIKDEEAEFFRRISPTECITMPHVEPECRVLRRRCPEDEGYLVIGMIGTMNSVNVYNARAFVTEVLPYFKQQLAPIKIRFAGGMCSALTEFAELPGIDLMGRVETVDDFYASVDLVTVPLSFSTGLKIKAIEAFASGMPIVAIGHALEGIPSDHPWHHCKTMNDVADACIKLAYQPELLESLTFATLDTYNKVKLQAVIAFDQVATKIKARPKIVLTCGREFFNGDSPYREHVSQTANYLRHLGQIIFYFDQPLPVSQATLFECFNGLAEYGKVALSPVCVNASRSVGMTSFTATLAELIAENPRVTLWMLRLSDEFANLNRPSIHHTKVYLRLDSLRLYQPDAMATLPQLALGIDNLTLVDSHDQLTRCVNSPGIKFACVPFWRWKPWQVGGKPQQNRIDILADTVQQFKLAEAVAHYVASLCPEWSYPRIIAPTSKDAVLASSNHRTLVSVDSIMNSFHKLGDLPSAVIDLSPGVAEFASYRETLIRLAIPILDSYCPAGSSGITNPATLSELIQGISILAHDLEALTHAAQQRDKLCYGHDAGWHSIWKAFSVGNALT